MKKCVHHEPLMEARTIGALIEAQAIMVLRIEMALGMAAINTITVRRRVPIRNKWIQRK